MESQEGFLKKCLEGFLKEYQEKYPAWILGRIHEGAVEKFLKESS